jgi:hypothetical protein
MKSKQMLALVATAALVSGCAQQTWSPGPNARGTFDETKGRCQLAASQSGTGFAAVGSQQFVAGAAVGNAVGNAIQAQNVFNSCMSASGWVSVDPKAAAQNLTLARAALEESKACVAAVRVDTKYDTVSAHFADPATGHYSFAQMADDKIPTAEEASLVTTYEDAINPCRDKVVNVITGLDARAGEKIRAAYSSASDLDRFPMVVNRDSH